MGAQWLAGFEILKGKALILLITLEVFSTLYP